MFKNLCCDEYGCLWCVFVAVKLITALRVAAAKTNVEKRLAKYPNNRRTLGLEINVNLFADDQWSGIGQIDKDLDVVEFARIAETDPATLVATADQVIE